MLRIVQLVGGVVCLLLVAACETPTAAVNFRTGPRPFAVRASQFTLPEELRDGTQIREIPCGPMGSCPSSDTVTISCDAGMCDPAPTTVSFPVGDVIDFDDLSSELEELFSVIDSIRITDVVYDVEMNTLTVPLGDLEVFWGPEGATGVDSPRVTLLGTVPPLPVGAADSGDVALDSGGNEALSDYLVGTSRRIRLFGRTVVDLEPGGPFPAGELAVSVDISVRASGRVID